MFVGEHSLESEYFFSMFDFLDINITCVYFYHAMILLTRDKLLPFTNLNFPNHFLGALLTGRTLAVLATTTLATSMAAREGPVPMAGHQICFQVWLALSLLNDALALAGQVTSFLYI